jgi:hypothetical protein
MATITVGVVNPTESEKVTMQVPDDAPVSDLTAGMVEAMELLSRGGDGHRLRYRLNRQGTDGRPGRELDASHSLRENRVESGDVLYMTAEMVAGSTSGFGL